MTVVVLGKVLGFFKDLSLSYYLGANDTTDAYFVSVYAAGLIYGGVYSAIPLLIVSNASESQLTRRNQELALSSMTILLVSLLLSAIVFLLSDVVAGIFLADQIENIVTKASFYIRIAALTFPLSALTLIATSIKLAEGNKIPSNAIAVFNSSLFIGAVYFWHSPSNFQYALYSTIFSWLLMVFLYGKTIVFLYAYIGWCVKHLSVKRFSAFFSSAKMFYLDQVTPALALYFAAQSGESFVSLFSYSNKLFLLYVTLFVVFINSYLVPRFAKNYTSGLGSMAEFDCDFSKIMVLVFPVTFFTLVNSQFLVTLVFDRGEITHDQLNIITRVFSILGLAIPFVVIKDVFVKLILINKESVPLGPIHIGALIFNVVFCILAVPIFSIVAVAVGYFLSFLLVSLLLIFGGPSCSWITTRSKINFLYFSIVSCALSFTNIISIVLEKIGGLNLILVTGCALTLWYLIVAKRYFQINPLKI